MKSRRFVLTVVDFVLAVVAAMLVGCGDDNPIGSELGPVHSTGTVMDRLGEQRALWEALGLEDYTYGVRRVCLCPFREGVRVTVVDGAVAGATDLVTGEVLEPNEVQWYLTIDGLFDLVQDAYDRPGIGDSKALCESGTLLERAEAPQDPPLARPCPCQGARSPFTHARM